MKLFAALLTMLLAGSAALAQDCDFDCTVKKHLDAIQAQDFESFAETITGDDTLSFILPNGFNTLDRARYLEMIKGWFAEEGWHLDYQVVNKRQSEDMGWVLLLVNYREDDRGGQPYAIDHFLLLIFEKQNGMWKLVHDQNTKTEIKSETEK
ncbi:MAG TPA: nuclear transport factor 2 family protein [Calditrichia bacterium]|nr:nuclear transport factor 2 family protein [Calditrichia bacterium]